MFDISSTRLIFVAFKGDSILHIGVCKDPLPSDRTMLRAVQKELGYLPDFAVLEKTEHWVEPRKKWKKRFEWVYELSDSVNRKMRREMIAEGKVITAQEIIATYSTTPFILAPA